jgi:Family of unknown function (DUF6599)
MKFITLLSITFWGLLASSAALVATQRTTIVNLASLPRWQVQKSQNVSLNEVRQWGVQPEVDLEYGVSKVEIRTYVQDNQTLRALVEKAPDPSSAYGLLTFYQNESMKAEKGMKLAVIGPQQALMARGTFFVRVERPPKTSEENFRSALITIAGAAPSANSMALLPPALPRQGIVQGSQKYVLGPVALQQAVPTLPADLVGFQQGAEVQSAQYQSNGQAVTLIFISYPTYSIGRARYAALEQGVGVNQKTGPGAIYGKLLRSYVLLVQNAQSKEAADRLMGRLTVEQQVSWDQAPPGKPVTVQMFYLIMGNIMLVLFLVGLAVFAGVLLFLSRIMAARWFPHSDWARGYEDSIIRLNLK